MSDAAATQYLALMFDLVREGGSIALGLIDSHRSGLKADHSVITETDLKISALAAQKLSALIASGGHALIDEEDPRRGEYLNDAFLDTHPFIWSLDPIDATRAYANRMPHYGISIGLIKDRAPWLGMVFFPSLKELFYCDGDEAYFVQNAFTAEEIRTKVIPVDEELTDRSVFIATDEILSMFEWKEKDCRGMVLSAAVCEFCWPSIGRGCGSLAKVHLWDFAGSWPIFLKAGLKMYSYTDGKPLERLDAKDFEGGKTAWKLKDYYILSSEKNFPFLKQRLIRHPDGQRPEGSQGTEKSK